ncbi:MAG TPA: CocE/NonD family hydrolase [Agriterribacter sp.]|nr:CocE/NonD family hydrolase [Agriterribacter sp.]
MNNHYFNKPQLFSPSHKMLLMFVIYISVSFFANAQTDSSAGEGFYIPQTTSYGSSKPIDITITMDDGISLRGVAYYPALDNGTLANEKFPVIIEMTPYPDRNGPAPHIANFNKNGYIFLTVRPRGTGGSEGEVQQFNSREGLDGKNVAYWAAQQLKGSNGSVGLFGCSYPGATALAAAAVKDKSSPIKAVISACIGLDMQYREVWTTNGLPTAIQGLNIILIHQGFQ